MRCKDTSGCSGVGIMNERGNAFSGEAIAVAICNMMDRVNGLGAGLLGMVFTQTSRIIGAPYYVLGGKGSRGEGDTAV